MRPEQAKKLSDSQFKRYFGIERTTYQHMLAIQETYIEQHKKGGRKPKLGVADQRLMTLSYHRE